MKASSLTQSALHNRLQFNQPEQLIIKLFSTFEKTYTNQLKPKETTYQLMLTLATSIFHLKLVLDKGKVQTFKPAGVFPEGLWQER